MFETLQLAPPDPILGLTDAFKRDTNPNKINLGVGVYQDEDGKTATLQSVLKAEARLLEQAAAKTYHPIEGLAEYGKHVRTLLFGAGDARISDGRAVTAQTPGGTGALRVTGDLLKAKLGVNRIWLSDPTWANHDAIFQAAGLSTPVYAYYDAKVRGLNFEGLIASLEKAEPGDAVLLHACCHNPSGVDPTLAQWDGIADVCQKKGLLPVFDFAYQGFGDGVDEDAAPVRKFAARGMELVICSSFSKNFGLYNERVGAVTLLASDPQAAERALSQLRVTVRTNYSSPPSHGGVVVVTVLGDAELAALWRKEVDGMRERILSMRHKFVAALRDKGVQQDFSFIAKQKGMFSFAGITPEQVDRLKNEHAIYAVRSGRINVAGMRNATMDRLCTAIAQVLNG